LKRSELEHIIRAAGDVLGEDEVIIVGSQSILGQFPEGLPAAVMLSREADVMDKNDPVGEKALRLNGAIGEYSDFDEMNSYYAEGVEDALTTFPRGWRDRLVSVATPSTNGKIGLCAEIHDTCVAKLVAGRDKDFKYVGSLIQSGHARPEILIERICDTEISDNDQQRLLAKVRGMKRPGRRSSYRRALNAVSRQGRVGPGSPAGGQFTGKINPESDLELADPSEIV
jgi:hypothetical protein